MKKIVILLSALFCVLLMLTSCVTERITVSNVFVNTDGSVTVLYSDGSSEKFDAIGNVGGGSEAGIRDAYINDDMHLILIYDDGRSEDFGEIKAPLPSYTVTFCDADGNVIDTQRIEIGKGAIAPIAPTHSGMVFEGWSEDFSCVLSDLTVMAQYRKTGSFTVTYKDYSGLVLSTVEVAEGASATPPAAPKREGYNFTGWSASADKVNSDMTITAKYSLIKSENVFDVSYRLNGNNTITVTLTVTGYVNLLGFEGNITLPSGISYLSHTNGDGATANFKDGKIYFVYTSNSGLNVTKDVTVMTVTLKYTDVDSAVLALSVADIYDQNYNPVGHSVIGTKITLE